MHVRFAVVTLLLLIALPAAAWQEQRLAVPVMVNSHVIPYAEFAIYVLPGST